MEIPPVGAGGIGFVWLFGEGRDVLVLVDDVVERAVCNHLLDDDVDEVEQVLVALVDDHSELFGKVEAISVFLYQGDGLVARVLLGE
jgi:hypothetical protein